MARFIVLTAAWTITATYAISAVLHAWVAQQFMSLRRVYRVRALSCIALCIHQIWYLATVHPTSTARFVFAETWQLVFLLTVIRSCLIAWSERPRRIL